MVPVDTEIRRQQEHSLRNVLVVVAVVLYSYGRQRRQRSAEQLELVCGCVLGTAGKRECGFVCVRLQQHLADMSDPCQHGRVAGQVCLVERDFVARAVALFVVAFSELLGQRADDLNTKLRVGVDAPQVRNDAVVVLKSHLPLIGPAVASLCHPLEVATRIVAHMNAMESLEVLLLFSFAMQQCLLKSFDGPSGKPAAYICVEVDDLEVAFPAKSSMATYLELMNSIMSVICLLNSSLSCFGYTQPKIM